MTDTSSEAGQSSKVVVTLFESYGSGASYVSERVAQALGVPLHLQAFSSEEIEDAMSGTRTKGCSPAFSVRWAARSPRTPAGEGPNIALAQRDTYELVTQNTRFVEEAAREGGVIVGRNGAFILAELAGSAARQAGWPLEQRIARAAAGERN